MGGVKKIWWKGKEKLCQVSTKELNRHSAPYLVDYGKVLGIFVLCDFVKGLLLVSVLQSSPK